MVRWPCGAAETAPIDERDIGAVAARALLEDGHDGADYVLTGPDQRVQVRTGARDLEKVEVLEGITADTELVKP